MLKKWDKFAHVLDYLWCESDKRELLIGMCDVVSENIVFKIMVGSKRCEGDSIVIF